MGSYACRPCGHYEGDHYLEGLGPRVIEGLWNEAGEQVRWNRATPTESVPDPIAESYKAYWGMA